MESPATYSYRIAAREIDFALRPTLAALADHVLAAAGEDADTKGFGVGDLTASGWTWVLSRFCIEMKRWPLQNDVLHVRTWVSEIGRMMTTRNFLIKNEKGEILGAAVSNWAVIDVATRRAIDLRAHLDFTQHRIEEPSPIELPRRLAAVTDGRETAHRVAYSDLDFNRHTNTIRYIELMADALPLDCHEERTVHRADFNFLHESRYGDLLTIEMQLDEAARFEIRNQDGTPVCRAQFDF
ncbi:MAG: hypothetical protein LBU95_05200 [Rikenellaceae bacterium]|jgi:acyl-ACP thioesterase|nr:hypothetical protein [Rikenellaceae bacterium]